MVHDVSAYCIFDGYAIYMNVLRMDDSWMPAICLLFENRIMSVCSRD